MSSATQMYVEESDVVHETDHSEWLPKPRYTIPNESIFFFCYFTREFLSNFVSESTRGSSHLDLISHLVNLTTGKEVLVNQYIEIIHERLLTVKDYDCDKEIQQVFCLIFLLFHSSQWI